MSQFRERYGPWGVVAGASAGLGAAFAEGLAARGIHVLAIARRRAALDETVAGLGRYGVETRSLVLDLGAADAPEAIARATQDLEVGIAIYNAALAPVGPFLERPLDELLRVVDVNVRGPVTVARIVGEAMAARGRGALVLMSSLAGDQGAPRLSTYAASKAFNTVLAEGLWHELGGRGVDVIACCAGAIRTPGYRGASGREAPGTLDAEAVVAETLDALGHGPRIVPGLTNRLASGLMRRLSRRLAVGIMARSTRALKPSGQP
jgi:uncharacterized protein